MREEGVRGLLRDSVAQERGRGRSRSGSASRCRRRRALPLQRGAWRGGEEEDSGRAGLGRGQVSGPSPGATGKRFLLLFLFSFLTFVLFS